MDLIDFYITGFFLAPLAYFGYELLARKHKRAPAGELRSADITTAFRRDSRGRF